MSEISEMMPAVNALLALGQMPSADQVRRMMVVLDKQDAEIERLTAEVERLRAEAEHWKKAHDKCNFRVCELLEEKIAARVNQQTAVEPKR